MVFVDFDINEMSIKIVYKNKRLGAREWVVAFIAYIMRFHTSGD